MQDREHVTKLLFGAVNATNRAAGGATVPVVHVPVAHAPAPILRRVIATRALAVDRRDATAAEARFPERWRSCGEWLLAREHRLVEKVRRTLNGLADRVVRVK